MRIGFVQCNIAFGEKQTNFEKVAQLIGHNIADIWVLPELFNTGYSFCSQQEVAELAEEIPGSPTTRFLIELARKTNAHLVAGLAERDGATCYNSAVLVNSTGLVGLYRKVHLFDREKLFFAPGNLPFGVWALGDARMGLMICFDWIFPEAMRTLALKGADIICHPSNLVLPYCQQAMLTRCLENRVFAVTANRIGTEQRGDRQLTFTGGSQIVDVKGSIIYRAAASNEEAHVVEIDFRQARDKLITPNNDVFADRRPSFYQVD
ncbi:MAG: acyltransferase [candidate division KSB1 bacterium]|nr:acyltransferase [candidate division KSB1 bacterium]MDZ7318190.1 acyltransferase [candidate division KSB1 bacterium]MDZ7340581.1 acyltransferase [candidate division KSB1 bacterium]